MTTRRESMLLSSLSILTPILLLGGCGRRDEATPTVAIQKVLPSGDQPLITGETVNFNVSAIVHNLKGPGMLGLIVQAADGRLLGACAPTPITNGAVASLEVSAVIPETASVQIFVPLYLGDSNESDVMDMRNFKVLGKRG